MEKITGTLITGHLAKTIEHYRTVIITKLKLPKEKNTLLKWAIQNIK